MSAPPVPLQISYQDPDGNNWNLSDLSMKNGYVCSAISGIDGIPVAMQTIPLLDGTAIPNLYQPQPGTIILAILVGRPASDSENDYYTLLDAFVRAFINRRNEVPAPGYLTIQRPDGTQRQIAVYMTSGLDTPEVGLNDMALYTLTLQTPDPYWSDLTQNQISYGLVNAAGILPLLPISLAGGAIFGEDIIINPGTGLAYPTWTITGPGTPTVTNKTTGRVWSLNAPVPSGQVVQVVTKRGQQSAYNVSTATSVWDSLVYSTLRDLWPLVGGDNDVLVGMSGATAATQITLNWTNRWSRA
jgi:hypothetical protein